MSGGGGVEAYGAGPERFLAGFVWFDALTCATAVLAIAAHLVWKPDAWLAAACVIVALAGVGILSALRPLAQGRASGAVTRVAAANWAVALGATALAPFAMPVLVITALLPAVLAVPYVTRRRLIAHIACSLATAGAVSAVGLFTDATGLGERVDGWVQAAVVIGFVPFAAALVAVVAWQNGDHLRRRLTDALDANARLARSERALALTSGELAASRARLAAAAADERRRIERDLHDGAQQRLVALALGLAALAERCPPGSPLAVEAASLAADAAAAGRELRRLLHGVYPAALQDLGLAAALEALALDPGGERRVRTALAAVGRRPAEVETAVYFCCAEAVANALKHAGPDASITLRLWEEDDDALCFEVADTGRGFDPGPAARPSSRGLQNMADRAAAAGGALAVRTAAGGGVTVAGRLPSSPERAGAVYS